MAEDNVSTVTKQTAALLCALLDAHPVMKKLAYRDMFRNGKPLIVVRSKKGTARNDKGKTGKTYNRA